MVKKKKGHVVILVAFFVVFSLLGVLLTQYDINFMKRTTTEISLHDYDTKIFNDQSACFAYILASGKEYIEDLEVEIDNIQYLKKEVDVTEGIEISEVICIPPDFFVNGDNTVKLIFGYQNLFFHVEKVDGDPLPAIDSFVLLKNKTDATVFFEVHNGEYKSISVLLSIYVNEKLDHSFRVELEPKEIKILSESYFLEGEEVSIDFGEPLERRFIEEEETDLALMFLASLLIFILPGMLITSKFLKIKEFTGFVAMSFAFSIIITVFFSWILNFTGLLSYLTLVLIVITVFLVVFPKKMNFPKGKKEVFCIITIFIFFTILSQFIMPSHDSMWSVYYERQVDAVYETGQIPLEDPLSYLGRPFTFVPGYMLLRSSYSWITSTTPQQSFFVFQVLGNFFFLSSVIYFCKKLKFDLKETIIFLMFLFSSAFVFGWAIVSLLHLFGFSLFLLALATAYDKDVNSTFGKKHSKFTYLLSGSLLGFAALFHASFIFGFPIILFALMKKVNWKKIILNTALAAVIFLVLYSYVFINFGLPNEIQKDKWGYNIKFGDYFFQGKILEPMIDIATNSVGVMSLAIIVALFFGFKKVKKLTLMVILLLLIMLFLTYRVNIFLTILAAALFIRTFNSKQMIALFLLFIASTLVNFQVYQGLMGAEKMDPFIYMDANSKLDSRILVEPLYGHTANYFGKRKTLADLYVEYADEEKYLDAVNFIGSWKTGGNVSILDKWDINYVITEKRARILAVNEYIQTKKEITFANLDKVYDNGFINIHYY